MREEALSGCPVIRMGDVHKEVLSRLQFAAGIFLMRIPSDFYGLMVFLFLEQRCAHFTPGGAHLCRTAALAACVHQKRIHFKSYAHKYPKRLYIWNGALYNKRELLRHAAQAACPSEKQMLDSVLNGNTVFFLRAPRQSIHGQGRGESRCAARPPTVWMGAARTAGAFSNLDVFGSRRGGSGILPTHACE